MGNSLRDALKAALLKKKQISGGKKSSRKKNHKEVSAVIIKTLKKDKKKKHQIDSHVSVVKAGKEKRESSQPEKSNSTKKTKPHRTKSLPKRSKVSKVKKKSKSNVDTFAKPVARVESTSQKVETGKNSSEKTKVLHQAAKSAFNEPDYHVKVNKPIIPNEKLLHLSQNQRNLRIFSKAVAQIAGRNSNDEREVNIGLDFGTSSVKVVIGDNVLNKAFAVPFYDAIGLDSFLLPSRIRKQSDSYSLRYGGHTFRNLKLQLIRTKCTMEDFSVAASFLALVIRHARCWLLEKHADIYRQTRIAWKLTLGLPAENYNNNELVTVFRKLAAASWRLSMLTEKELPVTAAQKVSTYVWQETFDTIHAAPDLTKIDFDVVPELSAQVYGFLTSTKFDPNARNIFMIVDIGAGTIDSSIFHVKRERAKRLSFEYYANFVEFNGVANLHATRMKWYNSLLKKKQLGSDFETAIEQVGTPSDFTGAIPENINDYFKGVDIYFSSHKKSPDHSFFEDRVKNQVLAKTLKNARNGVESDGAFAGMPVFVCGGGSRMNFYKKLEGHLLSHPNASWFRFKPRKLDVPKMLDAPGVVQNDFDRLSVAFGLSFVHVAQCTKKTTPPPPTPQSSKNPPCPGCGSRTICYCG